MNKLNLDKHWMPFSANRDFKGHPRMIVKAEGIYYWNQEGQKILDGSAGLFTSPLGHCRPEIAEAVAKQLSTLDYIPHFNTGHPLSFELADKLAEVLPQDINRIFFTTDGSSAIDTVIKIIYAYWRARKQGQKTILVSREKTYHGMNIGGTALSGISNNRRQLPYFALPVVHMRHTWLKENWFSRGMPDNGAELAEDLQKFIDFHGSENIAACFIEPIAGSIGCIVPPKGYLERIREICTKNDILLVFDEVICGYGRSGDWFAAKAFNVKPDIITMAKALTNGAIPMGMAAVKTDIYDAIVNNADEKMIELFHGYTYSAHPVSCAAALATLDIFHRDKIIARIGKLSRHLEDALFQLQDIPVVKDIRNCGLFAGIELEPKGKPSLRGTEAYQNLFWSGLHLKATGDALIIAPAFIMEPKDIDRICELIRAELKKH